MAYDEKLAQRMRSALSSCTAVTEKKMFGGICFLQNGNMVGGVIKDELIVRVGVDATDAMLERPYAKPMDFTGHALRGFVCVLPAGCRTEAQVSKWTDEALRFVEALPPKVPGPGKKRK